MRHTPEVNGASSPPLLYAECASPLETGLFPVHARWCPRGSRKGASSVEDRTRETADGPGCRAVPLEAPRAQRRTKPLMEAAALAPRTQEGSACGHRTPPLTWTLPSRTLPLLHNPRSTTRTPDPLFLLDTSSPLDTLLDQLFDPLLILYVCPLTKKWSVYNFNGRYSWTVRDRITKKKSRKTHLKKVINWFAF